MNQEIEWFKRFAKVYLEWSHHNMDRIVRDIVKKHSEVEAREPQEHPTPPQPLTGNKQ